MHVSLVEDAHEDMVDSMLLLNSNKGGDNAVTITKTGAKDKSLRSSFEAGTLNSARPLKGAP